MSSTDSNAPKYECDVCGSEVLDTDGVLACAEHFYCNDCAIEVFHRSMTDINEFPASCCSRSRNGLPPVLFTELLGQEFMDKYLLKLSEYYTPEAIQVYCANAQCAKFRHPRAFDNSDARHTVAPCECGTTTCVGCKTEWQPEHTCVQLDPTNRPAWLPEYTAECRIKQCPQCRGWIELSEACNHMICSSCHNQFCFICLLPWTGFHEGQGCPAYGDPSAGYDNEGFERSTRAIHLLTGRNRAGLNLHETSDPLNPDAPGAYEVQVAHYQDVVIPWDDWEPPVRDGGDQPPPPDWEFDMDVWDNYVVQNPYMGDEEDEEEEEDAEEDDTVDFGLEMMFNDEQTLHDKRHPTIKLLGSAASGMLACLIAVHANPFSIFEEADENDAYFGLEMMFDDEQTLHDKRQHPTIKLLGSATSGMLECSIAVHENPFSVLEEVNEEE